MTRLRRFSWLIILLVLVTLYLTQRLPVPAVITVPQPRAAGTLELFSEPESGMAPVLDLIRGARVSVDLVMYQLQDQAVADALVAAAKRGVKVRVLLNHGYLGQATPTNEPVYGYLLNHGVAVKWTPSYFDLTHQKTLVIDGQTALVMTFNFTPQYYASGREFGIYDTDRADVGAIEATFDADWHGVKISAPAGDGLVWSPGSAQATLELINGARDSLLVYNEEMADARVTAALEAAARRGVAVEVCMTYATYWKEPFAELTAAGVQVRTYPISAPLYIHAKMILADAKAAFVGSENFSEPSLDRNRELGLIIKESRIIRQIQTIFAADWAGARVY